MSSSQTSLGRRVWSAEIRAPWPSIPAVRRTPSGIFLGSSFKDRWEPGEEAWIYIAGCEGTHRLATRLGMPVFKIGVTAGDIRDRLRQLAKDRYGATIMVDGAYRIEDGFGSWVAEQFEAEDALPESPVQPGVRAIRIVLPQGMTLHDFDAAFMSAVGRASIIDFLRSGMGRAHCSALDIDPAEVLRYTSYHFGAGYRLSLAAELVCLRPRRDSSRLCAIAEGLILRHLARLN